MRRFRIPMVALMLLVALAAVGMAALRSGSIWWASGLYTLDLILICVAAVVAIVRNGPTRAFAVGLSVFGSGYVLTIFSPLFNMVCPPPPLIHEFAMNWSLEFIPTPDTIVKNRERVYGGLRDIELMHEIVRSKSGAILKDRLVREIDVVQYRRIAHTLALLAFALVGGLIGLLAHTREHPRHLTETGSTTGAT